jgi:hypothetical protein
MGGGLAYFKTIRLCSITAALSNKIRVAINGISPTARPSAQLIGAAKWALQAPCMP